MITELWQAVFVGFLLFFGIYSLVCRVCDTIKSCYFEKYCGEKALKTVENKSENDIFTVKETRIEEKIEE